MGNFVNVGYGNFVNADKVVAVVSPESAPVRRLIQAARDGGTAVDVTQGRKTKAVILTDSGQLLLSALLPETLTGRCGGEV